MHPLRKGCVLRLLALAAKQKTSDFKNGGEITSFLNKLGSLGFRRLGSRWMTCIELLFFFFFFFFYFLKQVPSAFSGFGGVLRRGPRKVLWARKTFLGETSLTQRDCVI